MTRHFGGGERVVAEPHVLVSEIRKAAHHLGFVGVGLTSVEPLVEAKTRLAAWLGRGYHGEMGYLAGSDRTTPGSLLREAETMISVAWPTARDWAGDLVPADALTGRIARYARGTDYHVVIKERLRTLADGIAGLVGRPVLARACVDTAPLAEHAVAARAGLGFTGRNTLTIIPGVGSHVLLGELLLDVVLPPDNPAQPRCGRCSRCLDACPTRAFVAPYVLDARRCISYLTIELRGVIPRELRSLIGTWVFGCDVCQDACPYNRSRRSAAGAGPPQAPVAAPELVDLLCLTSSGHRRLTRGTALERVSRQRLARNAAVALGNTRDPRAIAPLTHALAHDRSALVRLHAAWALGQLGATEPLLRAASSDTDQSVRDEAALELEQPRATKPPGLT